MSDFREQARALNAARARDRAPRARRWRARATRQLRGRRDGADGGREGRGRAPRGDGTASDGLLDGFGEANDPRRSVETLSDVDPLLLLPVRLETRFRTVDGNNGGHELWLRIYPDDCAVDSFEPLPSDAEITAAKTYWQNVWRAGGDDAGGRAAWKGLVGSCGGGRAAWLVRNYAPVNLADKPTRAPGETLLIAASEVAPAAAVLARLGVYWPAVWRANGAAAALASARRTSPPRSATISAATAAIAAFAALQRQGSRRSRHPGPVLRRRLPRQRDAVGSALLVELGAQGACPARSLRRARLRRRLRARNGAVVHRDGRRRAVAADPRHRPQRAAGRAARPGRR